MNYICQQEEAIRFSYIPCVSEIWRQQKFALFYILCASETWRQQEEAFCFSYIPCPRYFHIFGDKGIRLRFANVKENFEPCYSKKKFEPCTKRTFRTLSPNLFSHFG